MNTMRPQAADRLAWSHTEVPLLSDAEFRLISDLVHDECGINLGIEKKTFLESRLKRRMDEVGIKSGYEYYNLIKHSPKRYDELRVLLDVLMISETSFFRNRPQFDLFADVVLPKLSALKPAVA